MLRLQKLITWNKHRIDSEQAALKVIQQRANAGVVGEADVMRMQLRLVKSQAQQALLVSQQSQSLKVLSANWAEPPDFTTVAGELTILPPLPDKATLDKALRATPDYLLARAKTRINEAQLALEQAQSKANITVGAGIKRLEASNDNAFVFSFSMPLQWQDQNQGNIATAQALYQQNLAQQELLMAQLKLALQRIQSAMQNNINQVERLKGDLLPIAQSLLDEVKRGYQLGIYGVLQWVDAQDELFNIERDLVEAQHAVHLQFLELERLSGNSLTNISLPNAAHKE